VAIEQERELFDKACEITASAVRGAMGGENSMPASYIGDVFREIYRALQEGSSQMPDKRQAGF
jgi:hypothetical protein